MSKYIKADYLKAIMKNDRLLQGNCEYELWAQQVNKYVDSLPSIELADRKTENSSEKPNNCETCKWGEWYRNGYDITMMSDECGGCCSWNNKWKPKDEPQTDCSWK